MSDHSPERSRVQIPCMMDGATWTSISADGSCKKQLCKQSTHRCKSNHRYLCTAIGQILSFKIAEATRKDILSGLRANPGLRHKRVFSSVPSLTGRNVGVQVSTLHQYSVSLWYLSDSNLRIYHKQKLLCCASLYHRL